MIIAMACHVVSYHCVWQLPISQHAYHEIKTSIRPATPARTHRPSKGADHSKNKVFNWSVGYQNNARSVWSRGSQAWIMGKAKSNSANWGVTTSNVLQRWAWRHHLLFFGQPYVKTWPNHAMLARSTTAWPSRELDGPTNRATRRLL